ncbi:hypothetical protein MMRN_10400 [Mycobacterium marinum]|nr:hypothetical protein MMRN_10400 [Mycobacterium marinum]
MAASAEGPSAAGRPRAAKSTSRPAKLSRDAIVDGALTFLDREGWDSLTINALATQLGTKGPSLYNHVVSLEDLRGAVRVRVIDDIIMMLNRVGEGVRAMTRCWSWPVHIAAMPTTTPVGTRHSPGCLRAAKTLSTPPRPGPPPRR